MAQDHFRYDKMVEAALRGVVRQAVARAARDGLPGAHHFYIGLRTTAPGVVLPDYLAAKFPEQMTIVLEHQFWGLEVGEQGFSVTLSFQGRPEQLTVPFAAVTSFADPSVEFGLQFEVPAAAPAEHAASAPSALPAALPPAEPSAPPERPAAERLAAERLAAERLAAERPAAERPAAERPAAERPAAEIVPLDRFRKR